MSAKVGHHPIAKLLIANRGEIALRVIRSARMLGIKTVAVYSTADAAGAHVGAADEAIEIGPPEPARSYLNIEALIGAARASAADAIHPGYGFLSESPDFAHAVRHAGLEFVGPPEEVLAALGDKVSARRIAARAGVATVPGIETADPREIRSFADRAGFPVVVKAVAGGGGRGMRVVEDPDGLDGALVAAAREARSYFGDGRVFVEKYLADPRHVEVQLIGDRHGGIVALGERDCSIQRRHQKIIEESPAPRLGSLTRRRIIEAAWKLGHAVGYQSAGTVEFLVEGDDFYFLEVNARLQVEHPVTEMRFGCDLVHEQLKIAAGAKVADPPEPRGAAIECRIYAEDAAHEFRPGTGTVLHLNVPGGPDVRFDTHLSPGTEVESHYDGLLGKLICWGADRDRARERMVAALSEFALAGVTNTAGFLLDVVASREFRHARLSTRFLDGFLPRWNPSEERLSAALIAAAMVADGSLGAAPAAVVRGPRRTDARSGRSPWEGFGGFELWRR